MNTLARTLAVCAKVRKLSPDELAATLGLSRSFTYALLSGECEFGRRALGSIARAFPELDSEILDYLRNGHDAD
jgi:predicted DNA-binding transcriptional regulator AlpA